MNEKRNQSMKKKRTINWWKWALLSIVSLVAVGAVILIRALQPVSTREELTNRPIETTDAVSLVSTITTEDAEIIMNRSLEAMITDERLSYEIILDEQLEIHSSVKLFNLTIPYTLFFDPYVTENGNLQLHADAIELSSFSLPVSAVLSLLAGELELPFYIGVDSAAQFILIDFNELSKEHDIAVVMQKIDLENNEIQLKLSMNQDTLIEGLSFDKE